MAIYVVTMASALILGRLLQKDRKIYMMIMTVILTAISACRTEKIGADTQQFCQAFREINSGGIVDRAGRELEYGFQLLCKILGEVSSDAQILIIVTSIFCVPVLMYSIYKNSVDVSLSVYLFIAFNYFSYEMNAMRQVIAICIILLGIELFLKKHKNVLFVLTVLFATLFHSSAITMLVLLIIDKLPARISFVWLSILIGVAGYLLGPAVFSAAVSVLGYSLYVGSEYVQSNYFGAVFQMLVPLFILFAVSALLASSASRGGRILRFMKSSANQCLSTKGSSSLFEMSSMYNSACITFIAAMMTVRISLFSRLQNYFQFFSLILIPDALHLAEPRFASLVKWVIIVASLVQWLIVAIYRPEWFAVVPYQSIFDGVI